MKILTAEHRGFCYGVKRAVALAQEQGNGPQTVHTLGPIIHNPQMVERLAAQGIGVAKQLSDIQDGTVIIRSHGVGPAVYQEAAARQLSVVDATCPHVKKAQEAAQELKQAGYTVVVIGEKNHPEVKSIVEWAGPDTFVIETMAEAQALPSMERLGIVVQTTFSGTLFEELVTRLREKSPEVVVKRTICTATEQRQQAAIALAEQVDVMIVIGGRNSANTSRLAELCAQTGARVYHIETAAELSYSQFVNTQTVGITAGASTPEWLIEEVFEKMQEFNELLNQELQTVENGQLIEGKVISIRDAEVYVDIGYKAEGVITLAELAFPVPESAHGVITVGDTIAVYVLQAETTDGHVQLSKVRADQALAWEKLIKAQQEQTTVQAQVLAAVKGGVRVAVCGISGFIPASQLALHFVEDLTSFVGQTLEVLPIEVETEKARVILSRRLVLQAERERQEKLVYASLQVGEIRQGTVQRLVNFGAFVDIGGVEGLVHISDLSWERVKHPSEVVKEGDKVEVIILKVDAEQKRLSLSLKQVQRDPWLTEAEGLKTNTIVTGTITKLSKFGAFVALTPHIEGLVHLSELSERRVHSPEEVVSVGQEVKVKILQIDTAHKRIALSITQVQQDAERAEYQAYLQQHNADSRVTLGDKLGHLFKRED